MFLHHEIRKSSVGVVNRKNLSGFCIRGGTCRDFAPPTYLIVKFHFLQ